MTHHEIAPTTARVCVDVQPTTTQKFKGAFRHPEAAVSLRGKHWKNGQTIKVSFEDTLRDAGEFVQANVKKYVDYAFSLTGLNQEWVPAGEGDIRISFTRGGSWSYLGTDNLLIKGGHTLQLGWLDKNSSEEEIRRVTVHEIFHAFGLGHEQGHPHVDIPWDKPKVYEYYKRTQGWDQSMVDSNVLKKYDVGQVEFTDYDADSIMQYPVPNELTIGDFEVGMNTTPSTLDLAHLQAVYPKQDDKRDELEERKALLEQRLATITTRMQEVRDRINRLRRHHYALNKRRKILVARIRRIDNKLKS